MVRPLNQFCCGCSLTFGVKLILACNLIQNIFYIASTTSNVIFRIPTFGFGVNLATQTFNAAFCLLGLPFIAAAIWGVIHKLEPHLRLYLYYTVLSFILDMGYVIVFLVVQDSCTALPTVLKKHGAAFACGFTRIFMIMFIVLVTGGSGVGFPELLASSEGTRKNKRYANAYHDGLFGVGGGSSGPFPVAYGALATPGIGGSQHIFNGNYHETAYPPKMIQ